MTNLINQGDHDSAKNQAGPIIANNVKVQIVKIELNRNQEGVLNISLKILEGDNRDKILVDRVAYYPNMNLTIRIYKGE